MALDIPLMSNLPSTAQSLLSLDEFDRSRRRQNVDDISSQVEQILSGSRVDPFQAALAAYASGDPMNPIGAGARAATETQAANSRQRQAAELKLAEMRGEAGDSRLLEKIGPALLRSQSIGSRGNSGTLPNGNPYIKSGTRFFEVLQDKDSPDGYKLKEIVSAEKTIMGADPLMAQAEKQVGEIFKTLKEGGAFDDWTDAQIEAWHDSAYTSILERLGQVGRGQPGITPSPSPVVNAAGSVPAPGISSPPAVTGKGAEAPTSGFPRVSPQEQAQRDEAGLGILESELSQLKTQRDSLPLNSPERAAVNRSIVELNKELGNRRPTVKTGRMLEQGKGYGHQEGVDLAKERKGWGELSANAGKLENNLTLLKQLYGSNKDIASGEMAPIFKSMKSGLESMGIKIGDSARLEDVINSVSTNMALHSRTSEGTNLLPGAMSNYEDQLLQKIQPSLLLTQQGRLQLIDFMTEIARSNRRMAEAATKYEGEKGRLDAGWNTVRERKTKEEMARLAILNRRIMSQYGSKK